VTIHFISFLSNNMCSIFYLGTTLNTVLIYQNTETYSLLRSSLPASPIVTVSIRYSFLHFLISLQYQLHASHISKRRVWFIRSNLKSASFACTTHFAHSNYVSSILPSCNNGMRKYAACVDTNLCPIRG
jgi:hypothetical protein